MTAPLADLLDPTGLQGFATADQTFFLQAAGQMIRAFCGWHIAPSISVTNERTEVGHDGIITLPSLHVTAVDSVVVEGRTLTPPPVDGQVPVAGAPLPEYDWQPNGVIELRRRWPLLLGWHHHQATVTYASGYDEPPPEVAAIGYEIALQAMSRPGANARDVGAGPYRVTLLKLGVSLDADQKSRLYEAGVVRAQFA
jgi:hypothetical protein